MTLPDRIAAATENERGLFPRTAVGWKRLKAAWSLYRLERRKSRAFSRSMMHARAAIEATVYRDFYFREYERLAAILATQEQAK